jgi:hypothetical protein
MHLIRSTVGLRRRPVLFLGPPPPNRPSSFPRHFSGSMEEAPQPGVGPTAEDTASELQAFVASYLAQERFESLHVQTDAFC